MGILAGIFGRARAALREVKSVGEDGWVDLDLPLTEFSRETNRTVVLAKGLLNSQSVGFRADLGAKWDAKRTDDGAVTFYWGTATLRSIGRESDAFVNEYARLLGQPGTDRHMLPEIKALAVGLADDPRFIGEKATKMKLFFHSESEERYAEVFLNVDRPGAVVQLHEKDPDYRANLLRALTETNQ